MIDRVIIDTSSLISALLRSGSAPRYALLVAMKHYALCFSLATFDELREVVRRPNFDRYLPLRDRIEYLEMIAKHALIWEVDASSVSTATGACRDPKDDKFLALALSSQAVALVTSDSDLLVLHP